MEDLADPVVAERHLDRYPGLADRLAAMADDWVGFLTGLLERIEADWPVLAGAVEGARPEEIRVTAIEELGDRHHPGRCVAVVTLEAAADGPTGEDRAVAGGSGRDGSPGSAERDGSDAAPEPVRWIYKPRDVGAERAFGSLVEWLEPHLPESHLLPRIEARDAYGWMAHVPRRPCVDDTEVRAFYRRLGSLAAVLHLLLARDVHAENVVACGPHPVIVDLEGVMPPRFPFHRWPEDEPRAHLLRSLILPERVPAPGGWVDPTALGGVEGPGGPLRRRWRHEGTDRMEPVWRPVSPGGAANRPTLDAEKPEGVAPDADPVDPLAFEDDFLAGFEGAFRAVAARRDALAGPGSPLRAFRGTEQRVALRSTSRYAFLLERSWSASAWREEGGREAALDGLADHPRKGIAAVAEPHERAALLAGDVPLFRTRCGDTEVRAATGERVDLEAEESGLRAALGHLERDFGADGLNVQIALIRQAFEARRRNRSSGDAEGDRLPGGLLDVEPVPATGGDDVLVRWVHRRLDRVLGLRTARGRRTAWPTLVRTDAGWRAALTDRSLAHGVSGVGWVLAHAGRCLERADCTAAARDCLRRLEAGLDDPGAERSEDPGPGLLEGTGGWLLFAAAWRGLHDGPDARTLERRIRERREEAAGRQPDAPERPGGGGGTPEPDEPVVAGEAGLLDGAWERARRRDDAVLGDRVRGAWCRRARKDGLDGGARPGADDPDPEPPPSPGPLLVPGLRHGEAGRIYAVLRLLFPGLVPRLAPDG